MPTPTLADSLATRSQVLGQQVISNLSQFYGQGVFYQNNMTNWYLNTLAPAALMATLAKYTTNTALQAQYLQMITEIVNRVLIVNVNSALLFTGGSDASGNTGEGPSAVSMGTSFAGLPAIEAVASIGWIINQVGGLLPSGTAAKWQLVCQANCTYLDTSSEQLTTYYVNGNYNVHLLTAYWLTAANATDPAQKAKWEDAYERAYRFIINPAASDAKWAGYGLIIDTAGVQYDWSDYLCHLAETNGYQGLNPAATFDPNYSTLQLDLLSRLFTLNRDYRIQRLMNSISNKVEPLINTTTWILDGSGGSRKTNNQGFFYGWYHVTALLACKAANKTLLDNTHQLAMWDSSVINQLTTNSDTGFYAPGIFRQLAIVPAVVRVAADAGRLAKVAAA